MIPIVFIITLGICYISIQSCSKILSVYYYFRSFPLISTKFSYTYFPSRLLQLKTEVLVYINLSKYAVNNQFKLYYLYYLYQSSSLTISLY